MLRFLIGLGMLRYLPGLLAAHLAVVNEGSPVAEQPFSIDDPELAQAFYGRLEPAGADYYCFAVAAGTLIRFSMLLPEREYAAGQRSHILITGPGLPDGGWSLLPEDAGMRQGTTLYRRTQRAEFAPAGGRYLVRISSQQGGPYCFCIGSREPEQYADEQTRRRVRELLGE